MHDPDFLLYNMRPLGLELWHREPGGKDAFDVCGWPRSGLERMGFMVRHLSHLRAEWQPYLKVRRWIADRCEECGYRFLWKQGRFSYMNSDKVWHESCMSLRSVRSQLGDLTGYVRGTADSDARWRAEYRLEGLDERDRERQQ